jgi:hypothetical protein
MGRWPVRNAASPERKRPKAFSDRIRISAIHMRLPGQSVSQLIPKGIAPNPGVSERAAVWNLRGIASMVSGFDAEIDSALHTLSQVVIRISGLD